MKAEQEAPERPSQTPAPTPEEPDVNITAPDFEYQTEGADPDQIEER